MPHLPGQGTSRDTARSLQRDCFLVCHRGLEFLDPVGKMVCSTVWLERLARPTEEVIEISLTSETLPLPPGRRSEITQLPGHLLQEALPDQLIPQSFLLSSSACPKDLQPVLQSAPSTNRHKGIPEGGGSTPEGTLKVTGGIPGSRDDWEPRPFGGEEWEMAHLLPRVGQPYTNLPSKISKRIVNEQPGHLCLKHSPILHINTKYFFMVLTYIEFSRNVTAT